MADQHVFTDFNYSQVTDSVFFGSCLPVKENVDELKTKGVQVIVSVQEASDEAKLKVDITGVRARAAELGVTHCWVPTPQVTPDSVINVVKEALKATQGGNATCYFHCVGGGGRGPTMGLAYMYWVQGEALTVAEEKGRAVRKIRPSTDVIQNATKQLLGLRAEAEIDFSQPLTAEQKRVVMERLAA